MQETNNSNDFINLQKGEILAEEIKLDFERDKLISDFGKATLIDRYLRKGEKFQELFRRVATSFATNQEHAQRLYDYMSQLWFMPATPVLSNAGTSRGLPISCYLNAPEDSLDSLAYLFLENIWLASQGGGIGTDFSAIRSIGEPVGENGTTSGAISFIAGMVDSLVLTISQGSLRRGNAAVYLSVQHPEIIEFIEMRKPTGGDPKRKALNTHHGVIIPDDFMKAVEQNLPWELKSPKTGAIIEVVSARDLWIRILTTRVETGEPYILFIDTVNKYIPEHHKKLGLKVRSSNLCSEITLPVGKDHLGNDRTAVCCLSSLNLEYFEAWKDNKTFIADIMLFLDNVLQYYIDNAPDKMAKAKYSAMRERSVGVGVMGFQSFLQIKMLPIESVTAKVWNKKIFSHIKEKVDYISKLLADERGPCPDAADAGLKEYFSNKLAIAPTASISIIANSSPGIEPYVANSFLQKTLSGSFSVKNPRLVALLDAKDMNTPYIWSSIALNEGSVQHLSCLTDEEKAVFKTAHEIDQRWIIELAADRTPFICQSQSLNIFLRANTHKKELHNIHMMAWKKGIKSLYYCRSISLQRADKVSNKVMGTSMEQQLLENDLMMSQDDTGDCIACQ